MPRESLERAPYYRQDERVDAYGHEREAISTVKQDASMSEQAASAEVVEVIHQRIRNGTDY